MDQFLIILLLLDSEMSCGGNYHLLSYLLPRNLLKTDCSNVQLFRMIFLTADVILFDSYFLCLLNVFCMLLTSLCRHCDILFVIRTFLLNLWRDTQ